MIFTHLLPRAKAWRITIDKNLRQFFEGLEASTVTVIKLFLDRIFEDIDPQKTRELDLWESQFGLANTITVDQDRRDRLDAVWKAHGGQSPRYLQDTLQAAGFDVYVHEWWVPGSEPALNVIAAATARNPFDYILDGSTPFPLDSVDGNAGMQDGNLAIAQDGDLFTTATGSLLVNKLLEFNPDYIGDGALNMQDGGINAQDGGIEGDGVFKLKTYNIPMDSSKYPYFLYIGGATFPAHATVTIARKNEFETLCLKICPAQQWLGILVDYS